MYKIVWTASLLLTTAALAEPPLRSETATPSDPMGRMVATVLGDTEVHWKEIFERSNKQYRAPILVLYRDVTSQPCGGLARAEKGPYYCPTDQKIYLDPSFFTDLEARFRVCTGKTCQLSVAFVIGREVGHHVQNLLGILPKAQQAQRAADSKVAANHIQVQVELQADCLAGIWLHHSNKTNQWMEPNDVEAALQIVAALGNDRLQEQSNGRAVPDTFSHGSSLQRVRWFTTGLENGTVSSCDTFGTKVL